MHSKLIARRLAQVPMLGGLVRTAHKLTIGIRYSKGTARHFLSWLFTSKEYTNFTYDLTELNKRYLAAFVSQVTCFDYSLILDYMTELEADLDLHAHILQYTDRSTLHSLREQGPRYGRRLGWYAIARALKPRVVVETGVDKGLGSCILASALMRNSQEGHPGYYYGTDINPHAGQLFTEPFTNLGKILYGDSVESLSSLDTSIDLFINDSDHSAEYEAREYSTIENKLSDSAIVLSDNAHTTGELLRFAQRTGRHFLFFKEEPLAHWYPGGGIGAAFDGRRRTSPTR